MAVSKITEVWNREAGLTNNRLATYKRAFLVITDTARDGPIAVRAGFGTGTGIGLYSAYNNGQTGTVAGVPLTVAPTESDLTSYVREVHCQCISGDGCNWTLTVDYAPYDPAQMPSSPLDVPPEVSWDQAQWEEVCDQDVHGNAIVNTAGDPFDPPVTRDNSRPVLRIVRNEAVFLPSTAYSYRDRTNSDTFYGAGAGQVKCQPITASRQFHPTFGYYFKVNYEFQFNPEGWVKTILNQGLRSLGSGNLRVPIRIGSEAASSPVPLDSSGAVLAPNATPHYLTFDVYEQVPFAPLNLDPSGSLSSGSAANFGSTPSAFAGTDGAPAGGETAAPAESGGTEG